MGGVEAPKDNEVMRMRLLTNGPGSNATLDVYVHSYARGEEYRVTLREGKPLPVELTLRMPGKTHEIKCWPECFEGVLDGSKPFEYRKNDRGFEVGDTLRLREWRLGKSIDGCGGVYTGREVEAEVTSMVRGGQFGIPSGYCVMGIRVRETRGGCYRL